MIKVRTTRFRKRIIRKKTTKCKKSKIKNQKVNLQVLTYNVCWECMAGQGKVGSAKLYGAKCGKSKINKCRKNILDLCSWKNYSFIALQEATPELAKEIIKELEKKWITTYDYVSYTSGCAYGIIIYESKRFSKINKHYYGDIVEKGRPYIFQQFKHKKSGKLINIGSFHGPHVEEDWVPRYLEKCKKLMKDSRIIVMGDFNREITKNIKVKGVLIKPLNRGQIKTVYNNDGENANYTKAVDNILITKNVKVLNGPQTSDNNPSNLLLPNNKDKKYTHWASDHRPISAMLQI